MSATLREHFLTALDDPPDVRACRVDTLILPTLDYARACVHEAGARVLGLSGPQGSGKSTLAAQLVEGLALSDPGAPGLRAVAISIDDFYLTHAEQRALAAAHPGSPYLEHRGYPGTHDVALGARTLDALVALGPGERLRIPRYDKGAHGGRGDRHVESVWPEVEGPIDLVILEGWMLGFAPVGPPYDDPHLEAPDRALASYDAWHRRLHAFVHLDLARTDDVVDFRVEAERRRRAAGEPGLSDADAEDYVRRFLIAYRTWVPGLRATPPVVPSMRLTIGADRLPLG